MSEILSPALPIGYMLRDTYTITALLGQGGFGITYLAEEDITGRRVVIKENFPGEFSLRNSANHMAGPAGQSRQENYEWALGAFLNEAKVLTRLRHRNIVPVLTAFRALGTAYYVMDYIGGKPLHEAVPRPQDLTEQQLLSILLPLLSALHYLHTQPEPLLHRDIKPANILIDSDGTPILIDFGAARSTMSTHTHSKVGTPGYAPLEQWANGGNRGPWTDLYAVGATCYRLLTGQEPPDSLDRIYADPGSELLATRPELRGRFSPALLSSIDKAFTMRPADRWQSAQDWLNALHCDNNSTPVPPTKQPTVVVQSALTPQQIARQRLSERNITESQYNDKLHQATGVGGEELLSLLISAGANVNAVDNYGYTPLYWAASWGQAERVRLLLSAPGIDINKANKDGWTPLYRAAQSGHTECVRHLLAVPGIDVNKADKYGDTPLHMAATRSHTECVRLLLAAPGIDVNKADKHGKTPLYRAAQSGHTECVRLLLAAPGIDVNKADKYGGTPLEIAIENGRTECVSLLQTAPGIDANKADKDGNTPLHTAAFWGHTERVRLLLASPGIDVNMADKYGNTPLHTAARNGYAECVRLLLAAPGIDVNKADKHGWTPLDEALENGHTECALLIQAAGGRRRSIWRRLFV